MVRQMERCEEVMFAFHNQKMNNNNLTSEQYLQIQARLQVIQQQQHQQQQQQMFQPYVGGINQGLGMVNAGLSAAVNQQQPMQQPSPRIQDWKSGISRQDAMAKLMSSFMSTNLLLDKEIVAKIVLNMEGECFANAASPEDYVSKIGVKMHWIKEQLVAGQIQQAQQMNQMRPQFQQQQPHIQMQSQQPVRPGGNFNPIAPANSSQQNQFSQDYAQKLSNQFIHIIQLFSSLKKELGPLDPAIDRKVKEAQSKIKKRQTEPVKKLQENEKNFMREYAKLFLIHITPLLDSAIYCIYQQNPNDPNFEQYVQMKWLFLDQLSGIDNNVFLFTTESAIKVLVELKRSGNRLRGGSSKTTSSNGTPGETTPPFMATPSPLQPAIKREDIQAIFKRDLVNPSAYSFEEMCAIERSLYPDIPQDSDSLRREQASMLTESQAEMDANFFYGECKLIDPNELDSSINSRSFHSRWSAELSHKEKESSRPVLEEEVRKAAVTHQLVHNIHYLNDCVSILFHGKDNKTIFGVSIPNLAEYEQASTGVPPFIVTDLLEGFAADVSQMLHTLIQQGALIKTCLELLWPI